jgi:hypothetical protein
MLGSRYVWRVVYIHHVKSKIEICQGCDAGYKSGRMMLLGGGGIVGWLICWRGRGCCHGGVLSWLARYYVP